MFYHGYGHESFLKYYIKFITIIIIYYRLTNIDRKNIYKVNKRLVNIIDPRVVEF